MKRIKPMKQIKQIKEISRVWAALMLCMAVFSLGACGKNESGNAGKDRQTQGEAQSGTEQNVGASQNSNSQTEGEKPPQAAPLAEAPASDFQYKEEDGKITITYYTGKSMEIAIPSQIDGKDVVAIGDYCFANKDITALVCPNTLETIGEHAFSNCGKLKELVLNDGLQSIEEYAFLYCESLDFIRIPSSVNLFGDSSFSNTGLTNMEYLASAEEFPQSCFMGTNLEEVVIPGSIKKIGTAAFANSKKLKKVIIEDGVESIEKISIAGCPLLTDISIPASVTEIAGKAFSENSSDLVLTVQPGSYAESYAKDNNIAYVNP